MVSNPDTVVVQWGQWCHSGWYSGASGVTVGGTVGQAVNHCGGTVGPVVSQCGTVGPVVSQCGTVGTGGPGAWSRGTRGVRTMAPYPLPRAPPPHYPVPHHPLPGTGMSVGAVVP